MNKKCLTLLLFTWLLWGWAGPAKAQLLEPLMGLVSWGMSSEAVKQRDGKPAEESTSGPKIYISYPCQLGELNGVLSYSFHNNALNSVYFSMPELDLTPQDAEAFLLEIRDYATKQLKMNLKSTQLEPGPNGEQFLTELSFANKTTYINIKVDPDKRITSSALRITILDCNHPDNVSFIGIIEFSNNPNPGYNRRYKILSVIFMVVCIAAAAKLIDARRR